MKILTVGIIELQCMLVCMRELCGEFIFCESASYNHLFLVNMLTARSCVVEK